MDLASASPTDLTNLCHHLGWLAANTRITRSADAGAGNMNHTLRVWLEGAQPDTLILKQSLPYVARYPQIPAPIERGRIEAAFYQSIAADTALSLRTPKLLGFNAEHHILCMQDLGNGADMTTLYQAADQPTGPSPDNDPVLSGLLHWLWRLHAMPPPADFPANQAMRALNHEHIFQVPFRTDSGVALPPELAQLRASLADQPGFLQAVQTLGEIYLGQRAFTSRPALLHGDYYPGSWLHDERSGSRVIDPEFGFVGPPEFDVGVMFAHLTFAGYAPEQLQALLGSYETPPGFDYQLLRAFSAIEMLRRLLGVAQLPLQATSARQRSWACAASEILGAQRSE